MSWIVFSMVLAALLCAYGDAAAAASSCPVCPPLRLGTEAELPAFIKNKGLKIGCGNIVQMNYSCVAEITCFGTNPATNSETTLYYYEQGMWGGTSVYGTRKWVQNLICTPKGWAEYIFQDVIRANNAYYCVALPPPGSTSHNCSAPITTTTTTKSPTTLPTTKIGTTTTLAPGTCPVCPAFPFETAVPSDLKSLFLSVNNNETACGTVTPMNSSCMIQINCAGSSAGGLGYMYYKTGNHLNWYGLGTTGTSLDFICTTRGWARAKNPSNPWTKVVCMADLPAGQTKHICPAPPPPPPTSAPKPIKCPVDWYFNEQTNNCYTTIFNCSFDGCESQCQSMGAHLASIHSKLENRFINDIAAFGFPTINSQSTIGAKSVGGVWTWTDGTAFDYANWQAGRPFYQDTCGVTWTDFALYLHDNAVDKSFWEDIACDQQTSTAVCKKPAFP